MLEVVDGVIIGQLTHRAALCFNGKEIAVSTLFESWEEAIVWAHNEWSNIRESLSVDELQRLGWTTPELRYWP